MADRFRAQTSQPGGFLSMEMDPLELAETAGLKASSKDESIEEMFQGQSVPSWTEQITFRGILVSFVIGFVFSIIMMKLNLTTGLAVTMNVPAGLLGFIFLKSWTKILKRLGFSPKAFTRQENTIIQTCVVACYTLSYGGGFGSYLLGMSRKTYDQSGGSGTPGNTPDTIKDPAIGWMLAFLFLTAFLGLFILLPMRKVLIVNPKLTYPSGTATAVLINNFHTPRGDAVARKQLKWFLRFFSGSFLWGFFQWFFTGGDVCGFLKFPTFGLQALKQSFYFDFSMTYVGAGMICSNEVNLSMLAGAILSWGIVWPLIRNQKGNWYPADLKESSMKSLAGYKVFICIAVILGDGLFHLIKTTWITARAMHAQRRHDVPKDADADADETKRRRIFESETLPTWTSGAAYAALAVIATAVLPRIFGPLRWYYVAVSYVVAPLLAFCNAYGTGLTDQNMSYNYAKGALLAFAAWSGGDHGGVLAGLAACGLVKSMLAAAADLMHDFKTGYLTLTSPRAMLTAQLLGTAIGCVVAPLTFWMFYTTFDVGGEGQYKAPYALVYRSMAILGVEGLGALPAHCLQLCAVAFAGALALDGIREFAPARVARVLPLPTAMAIPMLVGAYLAVDMCVGGFLAFLWRRTRRRSGESDADKDAAVAVLASGLLCGDGLWTLPSSLLALFGAQPPICMRFLSRSANSRLVASGLLGASS